MSCKNFRQESLNDTLELTVDIIGTNETCDESENLIAQIIVKNNTHKPESFWILKCLWEKSFKSSNDSIKFRLRECNGNFPISIKLNPNDSICFYGILENRLSRVITMDPSFQFQIGLVKLSEEYLMMHEIPTDPEITKKRRTIWSNPIKLDHSNFGYKINIKTNQ